MSPKCISMNEKFQENLNYLTKRYENEGPWINVLIQRYRESLNHQKYSLARCCLISAINMQVENKHFQVK